MKDLVNEGRHLQDSFKNKLKESPMDAPTGPSKADEHYKINHPVLTILKIEELITWFTKVLQVTKVIINQCTRSISTQK